MIEKLRIGFLGDDVWAQKLLIRLIKDKQIELCFVACRFSKKDKILEKISKKKGLNFVKIKDINSKKIIKFIKEKNLDLLISMSYDQIFKKEVISLMNGMIVNCHAGKLPEYRGRNVLNWAIINGEKYFGITIHFINEKIDQGKIIDIQKYKISSKDDYKSILKKAHKECPKLFYKNIKKIQRGKFKSYSQRNLIGGKYYKRRIKGDEILDIKKYNSQEIKNFVRALVPPGPMARINVLNNQILIEKVKLVNNKSLLKTFKENNISIFGKKIYIKSIDLKILLLEKYHLKKKMKIKHLKV